MSVLVGKQAPDFTAQAVMPDNEIKADFNLKKKAKAKMSCYSSGRSILLSSARRKSSLSTIASNEFKTRNTLVIGVSVDSQFTHFAWKNTAPENGGIGQIQFPMVADITKQISRDYDVLINDAVALRGTFLIDKNGVVRHQLVNDLPLGRNVDEAIRMVDALQFHEEHGEVCPAGWNRGDEGMKADAKGVAAYLGKKAKKL